MERMINLSTMAPRGGGFRLVNLRARANASIRGARRCLCCGSRRTVAEWTRTPARPAVSGAAGSWPATPPRVGFGVVACDACGAC